jgi:hypothetical protein
MNKFILPIVILSTVIASCVAHNLKWGINYEGNKIIKHVKKSPLCIGYLNLQIAMDAPFLGIVADENTRSKGRTETQIQGYDETRLINDLRSILNDAIKTADIYESNVIIQIARGRSGIDFSERIIKNSIDNYDKIRFIYGYKSNDYFKFEKETKKFVFINIGMFARLTPNIKVGEICVPDLSLDIAHDNDLVVNDYYIINNSKNILKYLSNNRPKISLAGIADDMPFVTPTYYNENSILSLFKNIRKINTY